MKATKKHAVDHCYARAKTIKERLNGVQMYVSFEIWRTLLLTVYVRKKVRQIQNRQTSGLRYTVIALGNVSETSLILYYTYKLDGIFRGSLTEK